MAVFREWARYRYGVFSEQGFSGDKFYPSSYDFGGQERDNIGCNLTEKIGSSEAAVPTEQPRFSEDKDDEDDGTFEHLFEVAVVDKDETVTQVSEAFTVSGPCYTKSIIATK